MTKQRATLAAVCMLAEHDTSRNLKKIIGFVKEAAEEEAGLIVFPECCLQGYLWTWDWERHRLIDDGEQNRYFSEVAESVPGPSTEIIGECASRNNITVQLGLVEKVTKGRKMTLHNSVALMGPEGLIGVFRKVHNPIGKMIIEGGNEFRVFDTNVGRVGPIICADLQYPESVRVLVLKGAEIVAMSAAWGMDPRTDQSGYIYDLLSRANALMNGVWMVIGAQVGSPRRCSSPRFGHSRIIDPKGNIVAGIGYEEGLVTAKVNIQSGLNSSFRERYLNRRHPESYGAILEKK